MGWSWIEAGVRFVVRWDLRCKLVASRSTLLLFLPSTVEVNEKRRSLIPSFFDFTIADACISHEGILSTWSRWALKPSGSERRRSRTSADVGGPGGAKAGAEAGAEAGASTSPESVDQAGAGWLRYSCVT